MPHCSKPAAPLTPHPSPRLGTERYGTTFDGSYIGELPFLFTETISRQPFNVTAASAVLDAYSLSIDNFHKTLKFYPDLLEVMKLVAEQRLKKLKLDDRIPIDETEAVFKASVKEKEKRQAARIMELEDLFMGQVSELRSQLRRQSTVANRGEAQMAVEEEEEEEEEE